MTSAFACGSAPVFKVFHVWTAVLITNLSQDSRLETGDCPWLRQKPFCSRCGHKNR